LGVRTSLSWATEPERQEQSVLQVFEGGTMIWLKQSDTIYVFFYNAGTAMYGQRLK